MNLNQYFKAIFKKNPFFIAKMTDKEKTSRTGDEFSFLTFVARITTVKI